MVVKICRAVYNIRILLNPKKIAQTICKLHNFGEN